MDHGISGFQRDILRTVMTKSSRSRPVRDGHAEETLVELLAGELFAEVAHSSVDAPNGSGAGELIRVKQEAARRHDVENENDVENEQRSFSRAIAHLWRNGLVRLRRAFAPGGIRIELTDAGVEEARSSDRGSGREEERFRQ
jgi:hypothetical protein